MTFYGPATSNGYINYGSDPAQMTIQLIAQLFVQTLFPGASSYFDVFWNIAQSYREYATEYAIGATALYYVTNTYTNALSAPSDYYYRHEVTYAFLGGMPDTYYRQRILVQ